MTGGWLTAGLTRSPLPPPDDARRRLGVADHRISEARGHAQVIRPWSLGRPGSAWRWVIGEVARAAAARSGSGRGADVVGRGRFSGFPGQLLRLAELAWAIQERG